MNCQNKARSMTVERLISKCINTSNKKLNFLLLGCDVMVIIECISYFLLCIWIDAKVIYKFILWAYDLWFGKWRITGWGHSRWNKNEILIQHFQNGLVKKWVYSTTIKYFSSCRRQVSLKTLQNPSVCNCHLSIIEIILDLTKCTFSLKENFTL